MITRPTLMALHDWADQVCLELGKHGMVGKLEGEDWQTWGCQLFLSAPFNVPDPVDFDTWQEWAERLCEVAS